jgi:hypothetical protein
MQTLTAYSQQALAKAEIVKMNVVENVKNFHKEETSASNTSETGVLTYIGIAVAIIVGAIFIPNARTIITSVMDMFKGGTTKVPGSWV